MKKLLIISFSVIVMSLNLYSQQSQTNDSIFFQKYDGKIYSQINKSIVTSLLNAYIQNNEFNKTNQLSTNFSDPLFPILDTGCHYKIDFMIEKGNYYPKLNYTLVNYKFKFLFNYYHRKWKLFKDSSYDYCEIWTNGEYPYKKPLYENGMILYDTTKDNVIFICGTSFVDPIENEYFDQDTTEAGFINFIKLKYYNYDPEIEYVDHEHQLCHFYSKITKQRYYCQVKKKVEYIKNEELYHNWIVNFGELDEK